ncbi:MAG: MFS transporter [Pseudomonadota bacterium]
MSFQAFLSGGLALRVFLCFAAGYLLSYAFRAINAVIAPALQADLHLSNADLGWLSSAYFVSFAALQLPLGIWLDKYGARKTETALLMLAAAGAAIFAMGTSLTELWIGRALIGAGVSACLMAPFKAFRQWYAPQRQSQLASWMLVAGTSGALAATIPVAAAMTVVGWRGVFWIMAGLILLSAAAIFFLVGPVEAKAAAMQPPGPVAPRANAIAAAGGYGDVFGDPYFRRLALIGAVCQGSFIALQTLWAGPWMVTVLGMTKNQTSQILFAFNFCMMLCYLGLSWWAPRHVSHDGKHGWPVLQVVGFGLFGSLVTQAAILMIAAPWAWTLWIVLALFNTVMMLCQTQISLSFPVALSGRASSAYNLVVFIGAFAVQWGIGVLIDIFEARGASPSDAMRAGFALCLALQTAAFAMFALNRTQLQPGASGH